MLSALIMNYDLSLNYKSDLKQNLSDINNLISINEAVAFAGNCDGGFCTVGNPMECELVIIADQYGNLTWAVCHGIPNIEPN